MSFLFLLRNKNIYDILISYPEAPLIWGMRLKHFFSVKIVDFYIEFRAQSFHFKFKFYFLFSLFKQSSHWNCNLLFLVTKWKPLNGITLGQRHTNTNKWLIIINKVASKNTRYDRVIWALSIWIRLIPLTDWSYYPISH